MPKLSQQPKLPNQSNKEPFVESPDIENLLIFLNLLFFPTCQVRVVWFYVSHFSSFFSFSFSSSSSSSFSCDHVSSVWRAGPQPRLCEFSVACRTSTAILWVQCGVPDLNRDPVSSVRRAGPQPRLCELCGVPDLNRECVSSVWRAGPRPRLCEFSVACRTSTAILWVQCVRRYGGRYVRRYVRKSVKRYVRKNVKWSVRRYVRKNAKRYVR